MKTFLNISLVALLIGLVSCNPFVEEKSELGPLPSPSFEIVQGATPNDFVVKNTTAGAFLTNWEFEDNGTQTGEEAEVNYTFKGTYKVTMTTFNRGGSASITKDLVVTQDDPNACFGNFEKLTGCDKKVWVLAPEEGAMHIGPSLTETWWGNSLADITDRACHFDDKYIFDSDGVFEYDNNGDFWADSDDMGNVWPNDMGITVGCHPSADWPAAYKAWDSGVHAFSIDETSLTVSGQGAWIGLYKVGTTGEVNSPQSSVTFSIQSMTNNRLVLYADYGWGVWRITLVPE